MRLIKLTNSNNGRPVHVVVTQVASVYPAADGSTHVVVVGALFPVSESVEQVIALLTAGPTDPAQSME
jgi:hypothetical protein